MELTALVYLVISRCKDEKTSKMFIHELLKNRNCRSALFILCLLGNCEPTGEETKTWELFKEINKLIHVDPYVRQNIKTILSASYSKYSTDRKAAEIEHQAKNDSTQFTIDPPFIFNQDALPQHLQGQKNSAAQRVNFTIVANLQQASMLFRDIDDFDLPFSATMQTIEDRLKDQNDSLAILVLCLLGSCDPSGQGTRIWGLLSPMRRTLYTTRQRTQCKRALLRWYSLNEETPLTIFEAQQQRQNPLNIKNVTNAVHSQLLTLLKHTSEFQQEDAWQNSSESKDSSEWKIIKDLKKEERQEIVGKIASVFPVSQQNLCAFFNHNHTSPWKTYYDYINDRYDNTMKFKRYMFSINNLKRCIKLNLVLANEVETLSLRLSERIFEMEKSRRQRLNLPKLESLTDVNLHISSFYAKEIKDAMSSVPTSHTTINQMQQELLNDNERIALWNYLQNGKRTACVEEIKQQVRNQPYVHGKELLFMGYIFKEMNVEYKFDEQMRGLFLINGLCASIPNDPLVSVMQTDFAKLLFGLRNKILGELLENAPSQEAIVFGAVVGNENAINELRKNPTMTRGVLNACVKLFYDISLMQCVAFDDIKLNEVFWIAPGAKPDAFNLLWKIASMCQKLLSELCDILPRDEHDITGRLSPDEFAKSTLGQLLFRFCNIRAGQFRAVPNAFNWMEDLAVYKAVNESRENMRVFFPWHQFICGSISDELKGILKRHVCALKPSQIQLNISKEEMTKSMLRKFGFTHGRRADAFNFSANNVNNTDVFIKTRANVGALSGSTQCG